MGTRGTTRSAGAVTRGRRRRTPARRWRRATSGARVKARRTRQVCSGRDGPARRRELVCALPREIVFLPRRCRGYEHWKGPDDARRRRRSRASRGQPRRRLRARRCVALDAPAYQLAPRRARERACRRARPSRSADDAHPEDERRVGCSSSENRSPRRGRRLAAKVEKGAREIVLRPPRDLRGVSAGRGCTSERIASTFVGSSTATARLLAHRPRGSAPRQLRPALAVARSGASAAALALLRAPASASAPRSRHPRRGSSRRRRTGRALAASPVLALTGGRADADGVELRGDVARRRADRRARVRRRRAVERMHLLVCSPLVGMAWSGGGARRAGHFFEQARRRPRADRAGSNWSPTEDWSGPCASGHAHERCAARFLVQRGASSARGSECDRPLPERLSGRRERARHDLRELPSSSNCRPGHDLHITLSGLRSRWRTPRACAKSIARRVCPRTGVEQLVARPLSLEPSRRTLAQRLVDHRL